MYINISTLEDLQEIHNGLHKQVREQIKQDDCPARGHRRQPKS